MSEHGHDERGETASSRRRWWWALVLLLLLLLLACGIVHLLFPTPRGTTGKKSLHGMRFAMSVYGLHQPLAVAAGPEGEIAVADTGVQKALLFDPSGEWTAQLGGDDPEDRLFGVYGLEFHDGRWYVCDWILRRIWVFDETAALVGHFPEDPMAARYGPDGFSPYDIAFTKDAALVTTPTSIEMFSLGEFEHVGRFGEDRPGGIPLAYPNGIAVDDPGERVYVCDVLNRRVIAYDSEGGVEWILGRPDEDGEIVSFFSLPRGVEVVDGDVLVSDTFKHRLVRLDARGEFLGTYGDRGVTDLQFNFPEGLAVAPDGLVYVADRENDRVQVVRLDDPVPPTGATKEKWSESFVGQ